MIRWTEFILESLVSGGKTRFALVFHTEGLINRKVVASLREFGREVKPTFRPLLTVITPICPMYRVDPFLDPRRLDLPLIAHSQRTESTFASHLQDLIQYYDIGYHGHFFKAVHNRYRPSFDFAEVNHQFREEQRLLCELGHKPSVYAGGWWYITPEILALLGELGFALDTTVNDLRLDSFYRKQPFPASPLGEPFRVSSSVVEVPSIRSARGLLDVAFKNRGNPKLIVIALHDYDLPTHGINSPLRRVITKLVRTGKAISCQEILKITRNGSETQIE